MASRAWFKQRLEQADLVNLAVIAVFTLLIGSAGVVGLHQQADSPPIVEPDDQDDEDRGRDREEREKSRDDDEGKGKGHGKDDKDDDEDD